jgi:hypothetical protein
MMRVSAVEPTTTDGQPCLRFIGMTYELTAGDLDDEKSGSERGQADWTIPESGEVTKAMPRDDADDESAGNSAEVVGGEGQG